MVFPVMQMMSIDLQRISLGALIIALGLLVDDAMTTVDVMSRRLDAGDNHARRGELRLHAAWPSPMLTGSFVTMAGFVPIGFARSAAGEYTFSIFAVVARGAAALLVRRGALRAAPRRLAAEAVGEGAGRRSRAG